MTTTLKLKACARCGGDLIPEELLGDIDLVCLQCGHRTSAPMAPENVYTLTMNKPTEIGEGEHRRRRKLQRKAA